MATNESTHLLSDIKAGRALGKQRKRLAVLARHSAMPIRPVEHTGDTIKVATVLAAVQVIVALPAHIVRAKRFKRSPSQERAAVPAH